ncbi:MAG: hypothetical protein KatS3mg131_1880 [Candidatus Tectimicrobiota bacterium]|nr:MAG: hypothetical protein KatS3mg131_1880 [Candidatus Tectomicrobia bacterium]
MTPKCRVAGFTLTEVLVALVVLSLGLLGLTAMTVSTARTLAFSKQLTVATTLAEERLEAMHREPFANLTAERFPLEDYGTLPGYPQFRRQVTFVDPGPVPGTRVVVVTVSWRQEGGEPHRVSLQSLFAP